MFAVAAAYTTLVYWNGNACAFVRVVLKKQTTFSRPRNHVFFIIALSWSPCFPIKYASAVPRRHKNKKIGYKLLRNTRMRNPLIAFDRFQDRFREIYTGPTDQTEQRVGVRVRTRRVHGGRERQHEDERARFVRRKFRPTW